MSDLPAAINMPQPEPKSDFGKLGLDIRVVNALAAQGIFALEDLAPITESELAGFRGIGPGARKTVAGLSQEGVQPREHHFSGAPAGLHQGY